MESPLTGSREEPLPNPDCAVLVLRPPAGAMSWPAWYLRRITGVPFLLLNALHLQAGGLKRLVIVTAGAPDSGVEALKTIATDRRLRIPVQWISDPAVLPGDLWTAPPLVLEGSAVLDKTWIAAALQGRLDSGTAREIGFRAVSRAALENFLGQPVLPDGPNREPGNDPVADGTPGGFWISGGEAVRHRRDFRRQQERLLNRAGLGNDSLMDRWLTRPVSKHLTRWLVQTPLTPNHITWLHMGVGLVAAGYFGLGDYISGVVGGILMVVSLWLDSTDGEVARLRFQQSRFGGQLDIVADNVVHLSIFAAIGWGQYRATGSSVYLGLGGAAVLGSLLCFLALRAAVFDKRTAGNAGARAVEDKLADQLANRDFIYFLLAMAVAGQLKIFIGVTAVGSLFFAGFVMRSKLKPAPETAREDPPGPTE